MKKLIIFLFLAAVLGLLGWRVRTTMIEKELQRNQKNPVVRTHVEVAVPILRPISDNVETWGTTTSNASVTVYSNLSGKLLGQKVDENQSVMIGDTLAKIDRNMQPMEFAATVVTAPATGIVTKRFLDDGSIISPQTPLYTIQDIAVLILNASVSQQEIGKVRMGMPAEIECDAFPGEEFSGSVTRIASVADPMSHATTVEISLKGGRIKPGMYLHVKLQIQTREAILIPSIAVIEDGAKSVVTVVKSSVIRYKPVILGIRDGDQREIISGIALTDTLAVSGADFISEGDSVVVEAGSIQR